MLCVRWLASLPGERRQVKFKNFDILVQYPFHDHSVFCVIAAEHFLKDPHGHKNTGIVENFIPSCTMAGGLSTT